MYLNNVNDYGELEIDFNDITGPGALVTKDFLSKLSERFVERSSKYYEATRDHAFAYRERQAQSIMCPAIADITDSFLIENPYGGNLLERMNIEVRQIIGYCTEIILF